jgi:hypothetical protein
MHILINTCKSRYQSELPPLLASLKASGVPTGSITCVIGNMTDSVSGSWEVDMATVPYDLYELGALAWLSEQREFPSEFVFNMHGTMLVGPNFWNTIKDTKTMKKMMVSYSLHCGVYPVNLVKSLKFWFWNYRNYPTSIMKDRMNVDMDVIFSMKPANFEHFCGKRNDKGYVDFYGTGQLRHEFYYPEIDITKFFANDGNQGKDYRRQL